MLTFYLLLVHQWDPQNVRFSKNSHTVDGDISRNIGAFMAEGGSPDLTNIDSDRISVDQIYDIGFITSRMIGSFKVASIPSRDVSETKLMVQDVSQDKTFHSKGCNSTLSPE